MRSKSLFSHLVYSEAVVRRIRKIYRKTSMPEFLFKQNKQETPTHYFLRTIPEDCSENWLLFFFFFTFFWQFFTRIPEIVGTFWERFIFQIIGLFLLFMSSFYTMEPRHIILINLLTERNSDYIDKVFMQAWTVRKLETFYALLKVVLFDQGSLTFLV